MSAAIAAAVGLSGGAASAADLPTRKAAPEFVPAAPIMTWNGFYVGLNAGYAWKADPSTQTSASPLYINPALAGAFVNVPPAALLGANAAVPGAKGGFLGGAQVGYNRQISPSFVAGVEADLQGVFAGSAGGSTTTVVPVVGPPGPPLRLYSSNITASHKLDYLGTVRGRLGFLATPSMLLYATGGLAYGHASASGSIFQTITNTPGPAIVPAFGAGSASALRVGWALGAGGEWKFARNWSAKLEYMYYDLGSVTNNFAVVQVGPPGPALQSIIAIQARSRLNGHIVRVGLNYHVDWGAAPVVAKY